MSKMVCYCNSVTDEMIIEAIKGGATTVEAVAAVTKASTGCGRCTSTIETLISENK